MPRWSRLAALMMVAMLAFGACSGSDDGDASKPPINVNDVGNAWLGFAESMQTGIPVPVAAKLVSSAQPTLVAYAPDSEPGAPVPDGWSSTVDVYAEPADGAANVQYAHPVREYQGSWQPLIFMVVDQKDGWYQVQLNTRPHMSTGWVKASEVEVEEINERIVVDLSEYTLRFYRGADLVREELVGIGQSDFPTPVGVFYVTEEWDLRGQGTPYGDYAIGLSAYSDVLTDFLGGNGQVAIHGTSNPANRGKAVSHGCVRVVNDVLVSLVPDIPLGMPVIIQA
ncbi:MAG: L,D-transpeptidase [Acidimicrobiia bacterium]|nr:L,D-transpeptidase [Acidimicrobiia bacterium]MBP8179658.1 L,D-transpeptidase [Acidimicrobiia bacterium]